MTLMMLMLQAEFHPVINISSRYSPHCRNYYNITFTSLGVLVGHPLHIELNGALQFV